MSLVCAARYCETPLDPATGKEFCDPCWKALPFEMQERCCEAFRHPDHQQRQPNPAWALAMQQAIGVLATKRRPA